MEVLHQEVQRLVRGGLTGVEILVTWMDRRIQPLQARENPMYEYAGVTDSTRSVLDFY